MSIATARRFNQFVDNVRRRRLIWIAHAEIDDIFARRTRSLLELANDIEHIGGKALNSLKLIVHGISD